MPPKQKPFVISLVKMENGYQVQSAGAWSAPRGRKSHKNSSQKNTPIRPSTRLARQLNLGNQLPSLSQQPVGTQGQQSMPNIEVPIVDNREQEEFVFQVKRQSQLPQNPAKWFSLQQISEIQRNNLPEFFNTISYKTPELYLKLRNFIVTLHRKNPAEYLTKTACRRILRGDVNTIIRIHNFLEKQGIINFGLHPEGLYTFTSSFINKNHEMQHIPQSNINQVPQKDQPLYDLSVPTDNLTFSAVNKPFSRTIRVYCSQCLLISGMIWFSHKINETKKLCFDCFITLEHQEKQQYDKNDLIQRMNTLSTNPTIKSEQAANYIKQQTKRSAWAIDDNMTLLDIISKPGKSWEQILQAFQGRKTIEDIIVQFMQFPITNFAPNERLIKQKQNQKLEYQDDEYAKILQDLYQKSDYNSKTCKKDGKLVYQQKMKSDQKEQQEEFQSQTSEVDIFREPDNTAKMIQATLQKYSVRIMKMLEIQQSILKATQAIVSQVLPRRCRFQVESVQSENVQEMREQHSQRRLEYSEDDQIFPKSVQQQLREPVQIPDIQQDSSYGNLLNLNGDQDDGPNF